MEKIGIDRSLALDMIKGIPSIYYYPALARAMRLLRKRQLNRDRYGIRQFGGTREITRRKLQIKRGILCPN